jgi:hypothetical protein
MYSIKNKLYLSLIFTLTVISLLFIVLAFVLHSGDSNLTLETIGITVSIWAALMVLVYTLGFRLIDDALKRYETFAKPRINNLKMMMDSIEKELLAFNLINTPMRIQDSQKSLLDLEKYGRFFQTKLYPQKTLEKIRDAIEDIDHFLKMVKELESYWSEANSEIFLEFLILGNINYTKQHPTIDPFNEGFHLIAERAKERSLKAKNEKSNVVSQIGTQREKALLEIEKISEELNNFVETN